jgi:hypothetical protein
MSGGFGIQNTRTKVESILEKVLINEGIKCFTQWHLFYVAANRTRAGERNYGA